MQQFINITLTISIIVTIIGVFGILNSLVFIIPSLYVYQALALNGLIVSCLMALIIYVSKEL